MSACLIIGIAMIIVVLHSWVTGGACVGELWGNQITGPTITIIIPCQVCLSHLQSFETSSKICGPLLRCANRKQGWCRYDEFFSLLSSSVYLSVSYALHNTTLWAVEASSDLTIIPLQFLQDQGRSRWYYCVKKSKKVLPRFELGSWDSESQVLTITP